MKLPIWLDRLVDSIKYHLEPSNIINVERERGVPIDEWPPWKQMPNNEPGTGVNQGNQEAYWSYEWIPFWESLSDSEKTRYLTDHDAPENWKDHLKPGGGRDLMTALLNKIAADDKARKSQPTKA